MKTLVLLETQSGSDSQTMALVSIGTTIAGASWALWRSYDYHKKLKLKIAMKETTEFCVCF